MAVPYCKPPLSFKEQLDLLVSRGLDVPDRSAAEAALGSISYYRFSAYCLAFKNQQDCFRAGTTWNDVLNLYEFDRRLRILVLDAVERVEIAVRTTTTYTLAHSHGAFGHHDPANFRSDFQHQQWQDKCRLEIQKSHETFIQHFKVKYEGFPRLPIWMESEVMTFGSLSRLYEGTDDVDQQQVSNHYAVPHFVLRSWLRSLNFIRNVCAHHSRLWNRELSIAPALPKAKHGWLPDEVPNRKRLFVILVILNHLLRGEAFTAQWRRCVTEIISPIAETERFRLAMGLPQGWDTHSRWSGGSI